MWRNLANLKNVQSTIQQIGQVVAPPVSGEDDGYEDEEYYEEGDEYYEGEEEVYYRDPNLAHQYQHQHQQQQQEQEMQPQGFGHQKQHQQRHHDDDLEEDDDIMSEDDDQQYMNSSRRSTNNQQQHSQQFGDHAHRNPRRGKRTDEEEEADHYHDQEQYQHQRQPMQQLGGFVSMIGRAVMEAQTHARSHYEDGQQHDHHDTDGEEYYEEEEEYEEEDGGRGIIGGVAGGIAGGWRNVLQGQLSGGLRTGISKDIRREDDEDYQTEQHERYYSHNHYVSPHGSAAENHVGQSRFDVRNEEPAVPYYNEGHEYEDGEFVSEELTLGEFNASSSVNTSNDRHNLNMQQQSPRAIAADTLSQPLPQQSKSYDTGDEYSDDIYGSEELTLTVDEIQHTKPTKASSFDVHQTSFSNHSDRGHRSSRTSLNYNHEDTGDEAVNGTPSSPNITDAKGSTKRGQYEFGAEKLTPQQQYVSSDESPDRSGGLLGEDEADPRPFSPLTRERSSLSPQKSRSESNIRIPRDDDHDDYGGDDSDRALYHARKHAPGKSLSTTDPYVSPPPPPRDHLDEEHSQIGQGEGDDLQQVPFMPEVQPVASDETDTSADSYAVTRLSTKSAQAAEKTTALGTDEQSNSTTKLISEKGTASTVGSTVVTDTINSAVARDTEKRPPNYKTPPVKETPAERLIQTNEEHKEENVDPSNSPVAESASMNIFDSNGLTLANEGSEEFEASSAHRKNDGITNDGQGREISHGTVSVRGDTAATTRLSTARAPVSPSKANDSYSSGVAALMEGGETDVLPPPMPVRMQTAIHTQYKEPGVFLPVTFNDASGSMSDREVDVSPPQMPMRKVTAVLSQRVSKVPFEEGGSHAVCESDILEELYALRGRCHELEAKLEQTERSSSDGSQKVFALEKHCGNLEEKLQYAERHIIELQQQAAQSMEEQELSQQRLMQQFQAKEARILEAAAEDHASELQAFRQSSESKFLSLREQFEEERQQFERILQESATRADRAERQLQIERNKQDNSVVLLQKQQEREMCQTADKLAHAMAELDERDDQIEQLQTMVRTLQEKMNDHQVGAREAEDEMDELHHENEDLRRHLEALQIQNAELQNKVTDLHSDSEKLSGLKMELRMLQEERDRERAKNQHFAAAAQGNTAQLEEERDTAKAELQDLRQQLAAVAADLKVAQADTERVAMARDNLQLALESFQSEREAELGLMEEQRREALEAAAAAHAASLSATQEAHQIAVREIQSAADMAVRHSMEEIKHLESKVEQFRIENVQMRRSLDEAIQRLQTTQEDVIDRALMKNILMDWLTKKGVKERKDVLEVMASLLHFTEEEKDRVNLHTPVHGALGNIVERVAAPLPPSRADVEHLEGENVREKWVNFLLAETED